LVYDIAITIGQPVMACKWPTSYITLNFVTAIEPEFKLGLREIGHTNIITQVGPTDGNLYPIHDSEYVLYVTYTKKASTKSRIDDKQVAESLYETVQSRIQSIISAFQTVIEVDHFNIEKIVYPVVAGPGHIKIAWHKNRTIVNIDFADAVENTKDRFSTIEFTIQMRIYKPTPSQTTFASHDDDRETFVENTLPLHRSRFTTFFRKLKIPRLW
jgi:hypothetical protein